MKKLSKPKNTQNFDDALPERLLDLGVRDHDVARVNLHQGEAELSPFIVKLSRQNELDQTESSLLASTDLSPEDPIAALAKSFIIEHDDVLDDAPLVYAENLDDGLRLSLADLRAQLREDEVDFKPVTDVNIGARRQDPVFPVDIWANVTPIDVIEELELDSPVRSPVSSLEVVEICDEPSMIVDLPDTVRRPWSSISWFTTKHTWQRALAAFVGLAFTAVLPLQAIQVLADTQAHGGAIEAESKAALDTFLRGAASLSSEQFDSAGQNFGQAAQGFAEAESTLSDLNAGVATLAKLIPNTDNTVDSARGLMTAGRELSETAAIMSLAADGLSDKQSIDLSGKLELLGTYIENALPHAEAAALALRKVEPSAVPHDYADKVVELKTRAPQLVTAMQEYVKFVDTLSLMLGGEEKMRYLAVFQNNTELRPTGGFMGSFAELDVDRGEVVRMFVPGGGTYDVQGQLQAFVAAPGPLQLLKARWEFQDANWFPDFPTSAKKLRWFYSEAGGPTTDGVVAINATFVVELLRLLGPVEMPKYGRTFDAENFIFETQKIVEKEYDKDTNAPKEVIGDLAPILLERLKTADTKTLLAVVDLVARGLQEKDIQLNFRDNDLQATMIDFGWSGTVKQTSGDYLMVVDTNLGGGKTDGVIDQKVDVDVSWQPDGSQLNKVTITKTHRGLKTALFSGANNVDYVRLYVPRNSQLITADGFEVPADELFETSDIPLAVDDDLDLHMQNLKKDEATGTDIWEEDGKTVFGNWMQTAPGEVEVVTFTYKVPIALFPVVSEHDVVAYLKTKLNLPESGRYTLLVQKQSGVQTRNTTVQIHLPSHITSLWSTEGAVDQPIVTTTNDTDHFFGWLVQQN